MLCNRQGRGDAGVSWTPTANNNNNARRWLSWLQAPACDATYYTTIACAHVGPGGWHPRTGVGRLRQQQARSAWVLSGWVRAIADSQETMSDAPSLFGVQLRFSSLDVGISRVRHEPAVRTPRFQRRGGYTGELVVVGWWELTAQGTSLSPRE